MVVIMVGADSVFPPKAIDLNASIKLVGTPMPPKKAKRTEFTTHERMLPP